MSLASPFRLTVGPAPRPTRVMRDVVSEIDLFSFAVLALSPRSMREAHAIPCW